MTSFEFKKDNMTGYRKKEIVNMAQENLHMFKRLKEKTSYYDFSKYDKEYDQAQYYKRSHCSLLPSIDFNRNKRSVSFGSKNRTLYNSIFNINNSNSFNNINISKSNNLNSTRYNNSNRNNKTTEQNLFINNLYKKTLEELKYEDFLENKTEEKKEQKINEKIEEEKNEKIEGGIQKKEKENEKNKKKKETNNKNEKKLILKIDSEEDNEQSDNKENSENKSINYDNYYEEDADLFIEKFEKYGFEMFKDDFNEYYADENDIFSNNYDYDKKICVIWDDTITDNEIRVLLEKAEKRHLIDNDIINTNESFMEYEEYNTFDAKEKKDLMEDFNCGYCFHLFSSHFYYRNVLLENSSLRGKIAKLIFESHVVININNENFVPSVTRKDMTDEQLDKISYAVLRALHLHLLERYKEKQYLYVLIEDFVNKHYSVTNEFCCPYIENNS